MHELWLEDYRVVGLSDILFGTLGNKFVHAGVQLRRGQGYLSTSGISQGSECDQSEAVTMKPNKCTHWFNFGRLSTSVELTELVSTLVADKLVNLCARLALHSGSS